MKRVLTAAMSLIMLITCVGCISRPVENTLSGHTGRNENEAEKAGETNDFEFSEMAEYKKGFINMKLPIAKGWEYEIVDDEYPGIRVKKTGSKEYFELRYYGIFGVCGTGLKEESTEFPSGHKVRIGYYDGSEDWNFVSFYDTAGDYAATNCGVEGENVNTAILMLKQAVLGEGSMSNSEAIKAGLPDETYKCRYHPSFDPDNGSWTIEYCKIADENDAVTVTVKADGTVVRN